MEQLRIKSFEGMTDKPKHPKVDDPYNADLQQRLDALEGKGQLVTDETFSVRSKASAVIAPTVPMNAPTQDTVEQ